MLRSIVDALGLRDRPIAVLVYYGDDSGSTPRDGVFVVAGYLATNPTWFYKMEIPWVRVLNKTPSIRYFKAFECEKLRGEFEGWSRFAADAKRDALVDVIATLTPTGDIHEYGSVIHWKDYEDNVTGKLRTAFYNPYFFCIHGVVSIITKTYLDNAVHLPTSRVAYVFDRQSNLECHMSEQYALVERHASAAMALTMGSFSYADDRETPPLQMADLIAWLVRRDIVKPRSDGGKRRPELNALRDRLVAGGLAEWRPDSLRQFCEDVEKNPAI